ncbi:MAG TPA: hypothetical protein VFX02_11700 [Gammaproteobacteria bacterium]|nr:hypothetical protein [Gammaproteobacteria bacterium]
MNTLIRLILLAGAVLFSQASFALYLDAGLGNADVDGTVLGFHIDDSDTYIKLGVGDKINKNLNWEAGYWDIGTTGKVDGFFGDVKASMPLNSDTELFGKLGLYVWDGVAPFDGNDLFYGGGVTFKKIGPGNVNLELLLADLDGFDLMTIGGSYSIPLNM